MLVLAATLGACARNPSASAWAASVCEALAPWRAEIGTLTGRAQQQMTAKTTPAQAKENLVRLLGGAETASETARAKVARAGVPDVDGGEQVAVGFVASLSAIRDAYGKARTGVEQLAADPADAFYTGVAGVMSTLNDEYGRSALDTSKLSSPGLRAAFDEVPECQ
nr:hypothetical protein [Micromonospora sp. NBRC 107566]